MALFRSAASKSASAFPILGTLSKWWFLFILTIFILSLSGSIMTAYNEKSWNPISDFFLDKFVSPTISMGQEAKIIAEEGFWTHLSGVWYKDIFDNIARYATIILNIIVIYLYIKIISYLFMKFVLGNDSETFPSFVAGFLFFIAIQSVFVSTVEGMSPFEPVKSFYYLFRAFIRIKIPDWISDIFA